jgi:hypothetical protein
MIKVVGQEEEVTRSGSGKLCVFAPRRIYMHRRCFERTTQLLFNEIYLGYIYLFKRNI